MYFGLKTMLMEALSLVDQSMNILPSPRQIMVPLLGLATLTIRRLRARKQHILLRLRVYTWLLKPEAENRWQPRCGCHQPHAMGSNDFTAGAHQMTVLLKTDPDRAARWAAYFAAHAPDIEFRTWQDAGDLSTVRYFIGWQADRELLSAMPNLEVFFASGAGVDHLDFSALPAHVPLVRMVEPGIVETMVEYATMSVLTLHRNLIDYARAPQGAWQPIAVRPASTRTVGVMGLGVLGQAVLERLGAFGFRRRAWNRTARELPGVQCFAGAGELARFASGSDILACLLPLTAATQHILGRELFAALPHGAALLNVGRGGHLDQDALLEALAAGQIRNAILDVTDPEPLPPGHALWRDSRVLITPHIASMTQPETAAPVLLANLRRHMAGEALHDVVDRQRGY
jgi:glyoxylate/hydroxypyruvate reductase A